MAALRAHPRHSTEQAKSPIRHDIFIACEILLLILLAILAAVVRGHPGPLQGDIGGELDLQHWLRPHHTVVNVLDAVSTIDWPIPSAITAAAVTVLLLLLRRWLEAIVIVVADALANGANFAIDQFVHRPRPSGHGIYIAHVVKSSFSFPSGHVLQAMVLFGFILFLTFQVWRIGALLWPLRIVLLALILVMGPSRILEGEHWPSDVLGGLIHGAFWLLLAIHLYSWAARRWPRLLGTAPMPRTAG